MSYTSIRTKHSVGDTVFWYLEEADCVCRGVVVGIEARCSTPGYSPKFEIAYTVRDKWAAETRRSTYVLTEEALHSEASCFPPVPPDDVEAPKA